MAAQVRVLRQRIRSAKGMKKITKAMELVATSRIAKAQAKVAASLPYAEAITGVLTALASNARIDHPLLTPRERVRRAGVLLVTADRGLAGGYSSNAIRTAESLIARLRADGKEPVLYVIGRKGVEIEKLRNDLRAKFGREFSLEVNEIRRPEVDSQLVAENIAQQLERRVAFRRAMKRTVTMARKFGAEGIKVTCSGRLAGAEIARTEWYRDGRVPLQTLRADIDYGFAEARTTYGIIGVKAWIYKGEILDKEVER